MVEDLEKQLEEERKKKLEMELNRMKALKEAGLETEKENEEKAKLPYIMNISEDPTLAGMLIYHLKTGETTIGTNEIEDNNIKLNVLGIMKRHCTIINGDDDKIEIFPERECKVYVNGSVVTEKKILKHLDRITLGHANMFKLVIPGGQVNILQSIARYGQFLDNRLNSDSAEAKNTKVFLEELEHRIDKDNFAKFLDNYQNVMNDIDEANDYTVFRYKKYPLSTRNLSFRINAIVDIDNYLKGCPSLIILCEQKDTKEIEFVWSEEKFQTRLADMQSWYSDVSGGNQTESSFYEFDPWFDASDAFIK